MTGDSVLAQTFLDYSVAKLRQYTERIEVCLGKLDNDEIWARGQANENSIGNLCLHLSGNVRQWILSGIGGELDRRERDSEFSADGGLDSAQLAERLRSTVQRACELLPVLTPARLQEKVTLQNYRLTVLEAVYHVAEHFSTHTGQIVFATKALSGEDLGFYRHLQQSMHDRKTP